MIADLLHPDPRLRIAYMQGLKGKSDADLALLARMDEYFRAYIQFHRIEAQQVREGYARFVERYVADLAAFVESGRFPVERFPDLDPHSLFTRLEYDCALMLSIFVTDHRFTIMRALAGAVEGSSRTCVVGVGSGIELSVIDEGCYIIEAYDLEIDAFPRQRLGGRVRFHECEFVGNGPPFDLIVAIELLEHLSDPYALLKTFSGALSPGGRAVVTTARNIPQFDHLYNFAEAHLFEARVEDLGFEVASRQTIPHESRFSTQEIENTFYVLKKT